MCQQFEILACASDFTSAIHVLLCALEKTRLINQTYRVDVDYLEVSEEHTSQSILLPDLIA